MAKLCKYCGKKFEAKGRQTICSECRAAEGRYDEIYKAKKRKLKADIVIIPGIKDRARFLLIVRYTKHIPKRNGINLFMS